jgi:hypothetical protein
MPEQTLVMTEVQDELRYLLEAPALQDVRGAAALLETLARFTLPSLARHRDFGGAGIVLGGRSYVATFPTSDIAQRFAEEARRTCRQRTAALSLRTGLEEMRADELLSGFGPLLRRVRQRLEQGQAGAAAEVSAYSPELRWCDSCHRRPAVQVLADEAICRACSSRRTHVADQDARLNIPGYQSGLADASDEDLAGRPVWERMLRWLRDDGIQKSGHASGDIAALARRRPAGIGELADANGACAVVLAEINDFQHLLEQSADSQRALRISTRVNRLLDDAIFEACASVAWHDRDSPLNFEVLLAGGDRAVILLPADVALAVTSRALRTFESQSAFATEGRRLNFSAGIGLVPETVSWSVAVVKARAALLTARQAYRNASAAPQRGSWRSLVGFGALDDAQPQTANVGELERAIAHARTLRRAGLEAAQLQRMAEALQSASTGAVARWSSGWTDLQRRALAAVTRDLASGPAEMPADDAQLWPVVLALLPWVTSSAPPPTPRSRQAVETAGSPVERSA